MSGDAERNLGALLRQMEPEMDPDEFVYCTLPRGAAPADLSPICVFREPEADTLIVRRKEAEERHLNFTFPCRKITLRVHSSLGAVGFLAKIASELTQHGISTNCVSAYHHDHLFVPVDQAERALRILRELQRAAQA
jgi:hypothetical protein